MTILPVDGDRKHIYLPRGCSSRGHSPAVFAVEVHNYDNERETYSGVIFEVDPKSDGTIGKELPFEVTADGVTSKFTPPEYLADSPDAIMCVKERLADLVLNVIVAEYESDITPKEPEKLETPVHPKTIEELTQSAMVAAKINDESASALLEDFYTSYGKYVEKIHKNISAVDYYNKYYPCRWTKHPGKSFADTDIPFSKFLRMDEKEYFKEYKYTTKEDYEATKEDLFYNWQSIISNKITYCIMNMQNNVIGNLLNIDTYVDWLNEFVRYYEAPNEVTNEITNEMLKLHKRK